MSKFQPLKFFESKSSSYSLLPFRFEKINKDEYVAVNMAGESLIVERQTLDDLVNHRLSPNTEDYIELRAKQFLVDASTNIAPDLLAIKIRTRHSTLSEFTGLHIFVVTLRCEHSCPYCQVSRQSDDKVAFDMNVEVASKSIDLALQSPSHAIKIEFQGGESLLNFPLIKFIVEESKKRNKDKDITFVIATNLALIEEGILDFCKQHQIQISTSLDGPKFLHNKNRPRVEKNSYEKTIEGIKKVRERLGVDAVSALMTTTKESLAYPRQIVDEYIAQSFSGIFLRPLSPYGFALKTKLFDAYNQSVWHDFYIEALEYIIELNRNGVRFKEYYASTILTKIFTHQNPGYVDLMSPAGIGIGAIVYNYDGSVYASDEGRMLAEMGNKEFELGNVLQNSYRDIFLNPKLLAAIEDSFAFSVPMCNECAFEDYCGADPVFHHGMYGDYIGRKPESEFCKRNMNIFRYLFNRMKNDKFVKRLFMEWAQPNA